MMQVYEMNLNFIEKMMSAPKGLVRRTKIKAVLKQIKDWLNHSSLEPRYYADCHTIEERIRENRLKYERLRYPNIF